MDDSIIGQIATKTAERIRDAGLPTPTAVFGRLCQILYSTDNIPAWVDPKTEEDSAPAVEPNEEENSLYEPAIATIKTKPGDKQSSLYEPAIGTIKKEPVESEKNSDEPEEEFEGVRLSLENWRIAYCYVTGLEVTPDDITLQISIREISDEHYLRPVQDLRFDPDTGFWFLTLDEDGLPCIPVFLSLID